MFLCVLSEAPVSYTHLEVHAEEAEVHVEPALGQGDAQLLRGLHERDLAVGLQLRQTVLHLSLIHICFELPGYRMYFNSADKAGYSGTAVLTRKEPLNVTYAFGDDEHRHEGRVITAEY